MVCSDCARRPTAHVVAKSDSKVSPLSPDDACGWPGPVPGHRAGLQASSPHARTRARADEGAGAGTLASATIRAVSAHARCAAILQGEKQCRSVAVTGTEFCEHHTTVAAEHGAEAVRRASISQPCGNAKYRLPCLPKRLRPSEATAAGTSIPPRCALASPRPPQERSTSCWAPRPIDSYPGSVRDRVSPKSCSRTADMPRLRVLRNQDERLDRLSDVRG